MSVAALYVETAGCYFGLPGVDPWDEARDARRYSGPHPVVAHPPCQRWGKLWAGQPLWIKRTGERKIKGDDDGCFAAALASARKWGGVIEHPWGSHAWAHFGLTKPSRTGGWIKADSHGGWTCCVEQGRYGHYARKPTLLLVYGVDSDDLPDLDWGEGAPRLDPAVIARMGLKRAKRLGEVGAKGGGQNSSPRIGTPAPFRDMLIAIAQRANNVLKQEDCILQTEQHRATPSSNEYPAKSAMENFVFELKITANDANELANQVGMLAVALSAAFAPRAAAPVADAANTEPKTRKPRGKGVTIDHDANETKPEGAPPVDNAHVEAGATQFTEAELADQKQAQDEAQAEAASDPEPKAMTFDEMRQYTIAYLNDTIPTAEGRKNEFRSILDVFTAVKLGDIAAEKFPLVIAEVDRRKAAAAAAKKAG